MARRSPALEDRHEWISFEDPEEERTWMFDVTFLLSRWTCIFGSGCQGVLTEPTPELVQGCCSYGAHFTGDEDRAHTVAMAETLTAEEWQFIDIGKKEGVVQKQDGEWTTLLHDDACVFLNRPGFHTGPGCAFHVAATNRGVAHLELKPEVCWQLPVRRIDTTEDDGHVISTIREWKRRDWSEGGYEFSWWCTDSHEAFVGETTVLTSMRDELVAMMGAPIYELLLTALADRTSPPMPHPAIPVAAPTKRSRLNA